jgi:ubiquitin-protein ligase
MERNNISQLKYNYFELCGNPTNLYEIYFLMIGSNDSEYKNGYYMGKILLSNDTKNGYPFSPPDFIFFTPNGRFEINKKICLSNTSYHPSGHSPISTIDSLMVGLYSIFHESGISPSGELYYNHLDDPSDKKIEFAQNSINYNIAHHYDIFLMFKNLLNNIDSSILKKLDK